MAGELIAKLFVPGRPRTKGSLKPMHVRGSGGRPCKVGLTEDHALSTPWKNTMIKAIRKARVVAPMTSALPNEPYTDAVEVHAFYLFERQLSVAKRGAGVGAIIPSHLTPWPTDDKIGDEDKLRRNVLDALTQSGLIVDDRLVIGGMNYKRWCEPGEQSGVLIVVQPAPDVAQIMMLEALKGTAGQ